MTAKTSQAKTEAEAFLRLQEAASTCPESEQGRADTTMLLVARTTALPRLTLEVVAENERLRKLFAQAEKVIIAFDCEWPLDSIRRECKKLDAMKHALQEPSR